MHGWRLIESPSLDIAGQMEFDRSLFESFLEEPASEPLLRIYRVCEPGVTVGYSHPSATDCVRPTGGGRVFHGHDLIYTVLARKDSFPTFGRVRTSYLTFHEIVREALASLGVHATLVRCDNPEAKQNSRRLVKDCFSTPVPTDLIFEGKKIAGGAQRRRGEAFLHQGSVQLVAGVTFERLHDAFIESFERKLAVILSPDQRISLSPEGRGLG